MTITLDVAYADPVLTARNVCLEHRSLINRNRAAFVAAVLLWWLVPASSRAADPPQDPANPNAPVVNMPDGVQAALPNSVMVTHPDPQCPGSARFRRDSITYTEWANNKAVSTWTNTTETFQTCVDDDPNDAEPPPL